MRARDFILEQATAQPEVDASQSGLEQALQQDPATPAPKPNTQQVATALKKVAGMQPVGPTGNVGLDDLLFRIGGLRKKVGAVANTVGRGLNALTGAVAGATSIQRTQFNKPMRRGAELMRGVPRADAKPVSTGQQQATGIQSQPTMKNQLSNEQLVTLFQQVAGGQAVNPTGNQGIDYLLQRAELLK